jgi:hypothetical protein
MGRKTLRGSAFREITRADDRPWADVAKIGDIFSRGLYCPLESEVQGEEQRSG